MQINKIDFENVYETQNWHQLSNEYIKNLGIEITQGINGYCSLEAQEKLLAACSRIHMPVLTFLGSGNYHYLSYFLIQQIKQPFTLVLFDFHSDMQTGLSELLSCGNWLTFALRECLYMKQVFICGISEQYIPNITFFSHNDLFYFTEEMIHSKDWLLAFDKLNRFPIYVSIDKDVFDNQVARTNWDQGSAKRETIQSFFDFICGKFELLGGDVCGEYPIDYSDISFIENQHCNSDINRRIICCFNDHQNCRKKKIC